MLDFDPDKASQDFLETVQTIAGMSRFIMLTSRRQQASSSNWRALFLTGRCHKIAVRYFNR